MPCPPLLTLGERADSAISPLNANHQPHNADPRALAGILPIVCLASTLWNFKIHSVRRRGSGDPMKISGRDGRPHQSRVLPAVGMIRNSTTPLVVAGTAVPVTAAITAAAMTTAAAVSTDARPRSTNVPAGLVNSSAARLQAVWSDRAVYLPVITPGGTESCKMPRVNTSFGELPAARDGHGGLSTHGHADQLSRDRARALRREVALMWVFQYRVAGPVLRRWAGHSRNAGRFSANRAARVSISSFTSPVTTPNDLRNNGVRR
jgi:hypothetical protein